VDWVTEHWQLPDEGVWEVRGGRQEFLYSRLMCWVAIDRGVRLADRRSFPYPHDRWRQTRDEIYEDIYTNFWDPDQQAFVQHKGTKTLDAATLLMPMVKFISPTDPRWLSTLRAIKERLVEDSLVFRYRVEDAAADGLMGQEGTFNMCSFWYAEVLARSGDVQKARLVFEKMLGYANHVGLDAAEVAQQLGARTAWATCAADAPAYWPWRQVLRGAGVDEGLLDAGDPSIDDGARFRLFEAVADRLHAASRDHSLLAVLDDVQWADAPSLRLL